MPWGGSWTRPVRLAGVLGLCLLLASMLAWQPPAGAATLAFSDDFEDGNASGWTAPRGQWQVCRPPGQDRALCVTPTDGTYPTSFAGSLGWTAYSVEAAVYVTGIDGGIAIMGRASDRNHYYMLQLKQYRRTHGWFIHRKDGTSTVDIAFGNYPWVANRQYHLKLDLQGSRLTALISTNGGASYTTLGSVNDATYPSGRIGVRAWDTTAYVDDVKVYTTP
jgi:pectate lyase